MTDNRSYLHFTAFVSIALLLLSGCAQVFHENLPEDSAHLISASKSFTLSGKTTGYKTGLVVEKGDFYSIIAGGNVQKHINDGVDRGPESNLGVVIGSTRQIAPPINATLPAQASGEIGLFLRQNVTRIGKFWLKAHVPQSAQPNSDVTGSFHITIIVWQTKDVDDIVAFYQKARSLNIGSEQIGNLYYQSRHLKTYMAGSTAPTQSLSTPPDQAERPTVSVIPDTVAPVEPKAAETVNDSNQQTDVASAQPARITVQNVPLMLIVSPRNDQTITAEATQLIGVIEDQDGLSLVEIRVNGKLLVQEAERGLKISTSELRNRYEFNRRITLQPGRNEIRINARNTEGGVTEQLISLTQSKDQSKVWALVVGINSYANLPQLKYAVRDAEAFRDLVLDRRIVDEDHLFVLTEDDANINNLRKVLGTTLKRKAARDDMVLIFFAGHGATERDANSPDGDGLEKYLLPINADPDDLYSTAIPMREISHIMNRISAEKLIFIADSCYSGASGGRTVAIEDMRANLSDSFLERLAGTRGRVILTASGPNEVSVESDELRHGIFTYHLIEAIKGKADFDNDGFVTVDEAYQYVSEKVPEATGQEQHPVKKGIVEGQLVLGVAD